MVDVRIDVVEPLHERQRMQHEVAVHVTDVRGKGHAAFAQKIGPVPGCVDHDVLVDARLPEFFPSEGPVLRHEAVVADGVLRPIRHMVVDEVREHEVEGGLGRGMGFKHVEDPIECGNVEPVIRIDHLEIRPARAGEPVVDAAAPSGVLLIDDADGIGVCRFVFASDGQCRIGGAVVHDDGFAAIEGRHEGIDAGAHVGGRVIAGYDERDDRAGRRRGRHAGCGRRCICMHHAPLRILMRSRFGSSGGTACGGLG